MPGCICVMRSKTDRGLCYWKESGSTKDLGNIVSRKWLFRSVNEFVLEMGTESKPGLDVGQFGTWTGGSQMHLRKTPPKFSHSVQALGLVCPCHFQGHWVPPPVHSCQLEVMKVQIWHTRITSCSCEGAGGGAWHYPEVVRAHRPLTSSAQFRGPAQGLVCEPVQGSSNSQAQAGKA